MIASAVSHSVSACPDWLTAALHGIQFLGDMVGLAAMSFGFLVGALIWIKGEFTSLGRSGDRWTSMHKARLFVGRYVLLGLEFMIVSDIIHSFLKPDLESLYELGLIVVIRTAISFFLGKELEHLPQESASKA